MAMSAAIKPTLITETRRWAHGARIGESAVKFGRIARFFTVFISNITSEFNQIKKVTQEQ
jgi:hypothetical protein